MAAYKIKFNDYQMNIFNTLELNGNKRHNLMSVYSYLIKHSVDKLVSKSLSKLYLMYIRYHKKIDSTVESISKAYFCKLVNQLVDLELLAKDNRKVFILESAVDKKVDEKVDKEKVDETVGNSILADIYANAEIQTSNSTIDNYNIYDTSDEDVAPVQVNSFAELEEDVTCKVFVPQDGDVFATKEELLDITKELFKQLKIKSRIVKCDVIDRVIRYAGTIYRRSAVNYIVKIIGEMDGRNASVRETYFNTYIKNKIRYSTRPQNIAINGYFDRNYNAIKELSGF